jgi:ribosomal protein S12 methylthiotransferase
MAERYKDEILTEIEEVDAVIGTTSYQHIAEVVDEVMNGERVQQFDDLQAMPEVNVERIATTGGYSSYLKIAEGCDKHCTYCIIPKLRGSYRSHSMDYLIKQAESLARQGVRELNIVAQETTVYGIDLYGKKMLPDLLQALCKIEGIDWIRVLYCYPEEITEELIQVIKNEPKICHYLDLPIQHGSDKILKKMGRRTSKAELKAIIGRLREEIPDIALRTSLIAGFPGETEEDHQELIEFVEEMRFDRLGVFTYSEEEGTPAASMPDQISESVKEERRDALMEIQQQIAFEKAEEMVGRILDVLVEGRIPEDDVYIGRTYRDAPDVDGYVFIHSEEEMMSGDIVKVRIMNAQDYDLVGDVVYEFTE